MAIALALRSACAVCLLTLCNCDATAPSMGCPVTLLDIGPQETKVDGEATEGLQLDEKGLQYISQLQSPLYLVPMIGVYRGGKSLLMNRLMGKSAPYQGGFGVGHGQTTFTRGIQVCAEEVAGLGTVVWMDTEGLFSKEDARSAYGPKIFSLALLFSSAVLLNSVKVLNDQFFSFFGEQQQIARVLKEGLMEQGLPQESLLPGNLSVFWVLQQPIHFDSKAAVSGAQLESFLDVSGDETRSRVRRDFKHRMQEVPVASYDVQAWGRLHTVPDTELVADYVASAQQLRERVLEELRGARPLQAASAAKQLEMYVKLVQSGSFDFTLAKEAFEQNEIGSLCSAFRQAAMELAGPLPSTLLAEAFANASANLEDRRIQVMEKFHFGGDWSRKFEMCINDQVADVQRQNGELVLTQWQTIAGRASEDGSCFFLGKLNAQLQEYTEIYGAAFSAEARARALDYASALQRTRLVECVRLRDFLWPLLPWMAWPLCSFYLQRGLVSGIMSMCIHLVALAGIYVILQFMGRLPAYLDVDYPLLRMHPMLLNLVMNAPPSVPWYSMARFLGLAGACRSAFKTLHLLVFLSKPAGAAHTVAQMGNLELKLNILLKRSEATFKHDLAAAALSAAACLEREEARGAAAALVQGLSLVRDIDGQDFNLTSVANAQVQRQVRGLLANCTLPAKGTKLSRSHRLIECVAQGDFEDVLKEMVRVLQTLGQPSDAAPAASPVSSIKPAKSLAKQGAQQEQLQPRNLDKSLEVASASPVSCSSPKMSPSSAKMSPSLLSSPGESEGVSDPGTGSEDEIESERPVEAGSNRLLWFGAIGVCVTAAVVTMFV